MKLSDIVERRNSEAWRTIADYAVYDRDTRQLMVSPWLESFKHAEASHQFDERHYIDWLQRINRAYKYVMQERFKRTKGKR